MMFQSRRRARRSDPATTVALRRGVDALLRRQAGGAFEGEVVWCPMLAAQYALACHVMGAPIDETRKKRLLLHFERTRLEGGLWGLHPHAEPSLFVTTLVYVAARSLGVASDDPRLRPARAFFEQEGGVAAIPSWGKLWLAILGLYEWEGVSAILPEVWALPRAIPFHPRNFYCHTRLIYLPMSILRAEAKKPAATPFVEALRSELYLEQRYDQIDFRSAQGLLRAADLYRPPTRALRAILDLCDRFDRHAPEALRARVLRDLRDRIRWELRTTDHMGISPVSGLLDAIALHQDDPSDPDAKRVLAKMDAWIWEDDVDGARVSGARSITWDTAFALQALSAAAPHRDAQGAIEHGLAFLATQQVRGPFPGHPENERIDPDGGFCFAGVEHGWPVSDCTAEAVIAMLETPRGRPSPRAIERAARFMLRCQSPDGGFGSYEAKRPRIDLEWLNPAEMFGDSMTEHSYVECTASCLMALRAVRHRFPGILPRKIDRAMERATRWLRASQRLDGSFEGVWGVGFVYGTFFGIRGLLAAGASPSDPAVRAACEWLKARQREDGGFGESHESCLQGHFHAASESHVVQTSWALLALVEADDPSVERIDAAAGFLARAQRLDGEWPRQAMTGIFFRTALLEYELYRCYFPIQALARYETHRLARKNAEREEQPAKVFRPSATTPVYA